MQAKRLAEILGEFLDLEVEVKQKSDRTKAGGGWLWAGVIGALLTLPLYLLFVWAFGR